MKKYLILFNINWISFLQYRANLILSMIGVAIFHIATAILWINIYAGKEMIGGYSEKEMITYVLVNGILGIYIFYSNIRDIINRWITRGFLSYWIIKPINIPILWFTEDVSRRIFNFLLSLVPFGIVMIFFADYLVLPQKIFSFIFVFILAGIINYLIYHLIGVCAFWMENTQGMVKLAYIIITIAGGSLVPLSLFPGIIGKVFSILPFKYLFYVPMQIYLGKIGNMEILYSIGIEIVWIILLYALAKLLWIKGIKKYSAMGG